jgi:hypothetical protein
MIRILVHVLAFRLTIGDRKMLTVLTLITCFFVSLLAFPTSALPQNEIAAGIEELADKIISRCSGEVVGMEGQVVYINLGGNDSISEGSKFEVVRLGLGKMVNDKIYQKERPIAEIVVTRVRKNMSVAKVIVAYSHIQEKDRVYQKNRNSKLTALMEFPYGDQFNGFTGNLYESLSVHLVQKGFRMVERAQWEKLWQEQEISKSDMINIPLARKMGRTLEAQAVVLGAVTDMGNSIAIHARLVDVETGVALTAAQISITKSPDVMGMLRTSQRMLGRRMTNDGNVLFENDLIRVELVSFVREAGDLVLKLRYVSKSTASNTPRLSLADAKMYLQDETGRKYFFKGSDTASQQERIAGVPPITTIVFQPARDAPALQVMAPGSATSEEKLPQSAGPLSEQICPSRANIHEDSQTVPSELGVKKEPAQVSQPGSPDNVFALKAEYHLGSPEDETFLININGLTLR